MKQINIVVIATNAYFALGVRFIKKFNHHYKGDYKIVYHLFTDREIDDYLPTGINVRIHWSKHKDWRESTNSKFDNILSLKSIIEPNSYIYYFDADTNINKDFTEDWFLGDTVTGEHYANRSWMKEIKGYERNPKSTAYVPLDTKFEQMYFYGAFFGGKSENVFKYCIVLKNLQLADKDWGYEPGVNDESYINCFFHFHPPSKVVPIEEFEFVISDKGGLGETRKVDLDLNVILKDLRQNKDKVIDIQNGKVI